jgi:3-methylfumaryl-CoA hydratase
MREDRPQTLTVDDRLDTARARALWVTLGLDGTPPGNGDTLPPFFHQIYFWDPKPAPELGDDGHPARGGLVPDFDLPRRMWAGGRLTFHAPLLAGVKASRSTRLLAATQKTGRTGPLAFVTLRHEIRQRGALALTEDQDLVYRAADAPRGTPTAAPGQGQHRETRQFDPVQLFRYSALTLNGHRIHYDADYARGIEGYPGLVVHGPLLAQYLMLLAERRLGRLSNFAFRATAPLCLPEAGTFAGAGNAFWVAGEDGRQCMIAEAG